LTLDIELESIGVLWRLADIPVDRLEIGDSAVPAGRSLSDGRYDEDDQDVVFRQEAVEMATLFAAVSRMARLRSVKLFHSIGEVALHAILELPRLEELHVAFGDADLLLDAGVADCVGLR